MTAAVSPVGRAYLRWALTAEVGPVLFSRIAEACGDVEAALGASGAALERVRGIGPKSAGAIARSRDAADVEGMLAQVERLGARVVCRADAAYPAGLRNLPDAPIVLYVRGDLQRADMLSIAVVGTRRCSTYGREQARRFGELLAGVGVTVVSGLARGIDAAAHRGALEAGGRTIAVIGSGLHAIYPPEHVDLAEQVVGAGALISELPPGTAVRAENFPGRNRIIAGMTLGTLVVEAPQRSGALITARHAGDYNREVFALPGRANEATALGPNRLIRDGAAKLTLGVEDILAELGELGRTLRDARDEAREGAGGARSSDASSTAPPGDAVRLAGVERDLYDRIGAEPIDCECLLAATDGAGAALGALTMLELKGLVRRLPGQKVVRTTPA